MSETNGLAIPSRKRNGALAVVPNGVDVLDRSNTKLTAHDLDNAVTEVRRLKGNAAESYWQLGQQLREIHDQRLWRLRAKDNGDPAYKGFDAFVHTECQMTVGHAMAAIECATNYATAEEVRALGHTKATLILKAAPEDREHLRAKVVAGASVREVKKAVQESRAKHGSPKADNPKAIAGALSAKKRKEQRELRAATPAGVSIEKAHNVVIIEGSRTLKLFQKPDSLQDFDPKTTPRATLVKHIPFGWVDLSNSMRLYVRVIKIDGNLAAKLEFKHNADPIPAT